MRPVGYYVHHHGAGHWQRACLIGRALKRPVTLIGTFDGIDTGGAPGPVLDLPDDRMTSTAFDGCDDEASRPSSLHYAPLGHPGIRARMAAIAAWAAEADPVLMIVDVSVEVALLARLLSVPAIVVRLAGARTDLPHLDAFRGATRLLAPFPEIMDVGMPGWVREKTLYAGFLGAAAACEAGAEDGSIVVLLGRGGTALDPATLSRAAQAVPDRQWHVLGVPGGTDDGAARPPNLHLHGWVADVGVPLARAALVIGGAGDGVVAAVVAHGKRFVCLPEDRPYGEQMAKAAALARLGAAVVVATGPADADWRGLVAQGLALNPTAIASLRDTGAVARIAERIDAIAAEIEAR